MKNERYERIVNQNKAVEERGKNALIAFLVGGLVGAIGEIIIEVICYYFKLSRNDSATIMIVIMIFIASLCTALGFFEKLVTKFKCGLLIPITGFAHSITSAALEYKTEGLVLGIGANIFKLAGTVILYGVVAVYLFGILRLLIIGG